MAVHPTVLKRLTERNALGARIRPLGSDDMDPALLGPAGPTNREPS